MSGKSCKSAFTLENDTYEALYGFARNRVGPEAAADLVHEAYVRLLQAEDRDNIREPRAFLFRIVANLGIDLWRKEKRRTHWKASQEEVDFDVIESTCPGPESLTHAKMQVEALLEALAEVPEAHRHAFVLNKFEGMTHAAIAKQFGIREKTVQRQVAAVVAHCAKRLGYEP
jgi:RNA polymerase sigma factor (sigma-70 family)